MFELVGYVKNGDSMIVPIIGGKGENGMQFFFEDRFDLVTVYGFDDLPVCRIEDEDIANQLAEIVKQNLRGDGYCGFIWLSGTDMLAIKDVDTFDADLISKQIGYDDCMHYCGDVAVGDLSDDTDVDYQEILELLMNL